MTKTDVQLICYGTCERSQASRHVVLGELSYQVDSQGVRQVRWRGQEVIRGISWPIRDTNWGTMQQELISEDHEPLATGERYRLHFQIAGGELDCHVSVEGHESGTLEAEIRMTAKSDFSTNRAGFTVLHPIMGVAGSELQVTHADGSVENTRFPSCISPDQPVMDITRLQHRVLDTTVDMRFQGEIFEMEDQRNWSDASYKTYCVPLAHPFTYTLPAGTSRQQGLSVSLSGHGSRADTSETDRAPSTAVIDETASRIASQSASQTDPQIALVFDESWLASRQAQRLSRHCKTQRLLARLSTASSDACLDALAEHLETSGQQFDLEVLLPEAAAVAELARLATRLQSKGLRAEHVIALPESYLKSHQPSGPWPAGPTPVELVSSVRQAFPDSKIGAGMLTNFTEFNRCRPDPEHCDYVTYGNTAIVHAADDQSVMETLEALPHIFASTRTMVGQIPCRLGLFSIGGRTNPYGSGPVDNPDQNRLALARVDPRQRGLFAAAWAVGVLAATTSHEIETIALASTSGPFGIVWERQSYPQPGFDENPEATLYPLFHVVQAAASMHAGQRLLINDLPEGVVAHAVRSTDSQRLLLANTRPETVSVQLSQSWQTRVLDIDTFAEAASDPDWLRNSTAVDGHGVSLGPFATAFLERQQEH